MDSEARCAHASSVAQASGFFVKNPLATFGLAVSAMGLALIPALLLWVFLFLRMAAATPGHRFLLTEAVVATGVTMTGMALVWGLVLGGRPLARRAVVGGLLATIVSSTVCLADALLAPAPGTTREAIQTPGTEGLFYWTLGGGAAIWWAIFGSTVGGRSFALAAFVVGSLTALTCVLMTLSLLLFAPLVIPFALSVFLTVPLTLLTVVARSRRPAESCPPQTPPILAESSGEFRHV